mmetsp:Transcript_30361/g.35051  ORF Transcript_30361/g.35051 Transcript_30361/m.35051 type:complete len:87 (-) Transcript_30361:28-288(-)
MKMFRKERLILRLFQANLVRVEQIEHPSRKAPEEALEKRQEGAHVVSVDSHEETQVRHHHHESELSSCYATNVARILFPPSTFPPP